MPTYLEGVAVQFYRGIGPETQYIAPFSEMNFFVGPNNAGKSVVLNLIKDRFSGVGASRLNLSSSADHKMSDVESYRGAQAGTFRTVHGVLIGTCIKRSIAFWRAALENFLRHGGELVDDRTELVEEEIADVFKLLATNDALWFDSKGSKNVFAIREHPRFPDAAANTRDVPWAIINHVFKWENHKSAESRLEHLVRIAMQGIDFYFPERMMIPAKRRLTAGDDTFDDLSGKGLIKHLAEIQNPDHHERERKEVFDQINKFVQDVTDKPDAQLEVPNHREHLLVHMDNKVLPLSSLGTGIHEVILIAAFCTIHQKKIMCIEEPEIHLHPVLQRKLIRYLQEKTENQYFIATHSAAFIDTPGASVFRVHNDGVQTYVTPAIQKGDKRRICDDLGYRASDILQANAVIWVEGPSDRIYIRHWLRAVNADLIEGVHYTIMFYGGGLIKHLSADDEAAADFIRLRDLNRHIAVVIDSDKEGPRASLKPAAQRIKDEMTGDDSVVWITKGREIENYVKPDVLHAALRDIHTKVYGGMRDVGPYDHAFYFSRKGPKATTDPVYKDGDKVGAAERVCQQGADLDVLDLRERVTALAAMIAKANE